MNSDLKNEKAPFWDTLIHFDPHELVRGSIIQNAKIKKGSSSPHVHFYGKDEKIVRLAYVLELP